MAPESPFQRLAAILPRRVATPFPAFIYFCHLPVFSLPPSPHIFLGCRSEERLGPPPRKGIYGGRRYTRRDLVEIITPREKYEIGSVAGGKFRIYRHSVTLYCRASSARSSVLKHVKDRHCSSTMASSRGKNYSNDELKQLCNSVLHISECPFVGAGQRAERFWERVTTHYSKNRPSGGGEKRGQKSLESKWGDIRHDVAKFIGNYKQVEGLQISGTNDEDTLIKARELYRQNHPQGKPFTFECCFWILKECRRWSVPVDEMGSRKGSKKKSRSRSESGLDLNQSTPPTPVINLDVENDVAQSANAAVETDATESTKRPIGNKRAKDDVKRLKIEQDFMAESLRVQALMANATIARNQFNQGEGKLLKLLQIPTANLAPRVQEFVNRWTLAEAALIEQKLSASQARFATPQQGTEAEPENELATPQQGTEVEQENDFATPQHAAEVEEEHSFVPQAEQENVYVPEPYRPAASVYIPDTGDASVFMAEMERQFQGRC